MLVKIRPDYYHKTKVIGDAYLTGIADTDFITYFHARGEILLDLGNPEGGGTKFRISNSRLHTMAKVGVFTATTMVEAQVVGAAERQDQAGRGCASRRPARGDGRDRVRRFE